MDASTSVRMRKVALLFVLLLFSLFYCFSEHHNKQVMASQTEELKAISAMLDAQEKRVAKLEK
jgi:hypothetical protein